MGTKRTLKVIVGIIICIVMLLAIVLIYGGLLPFCASILSLGLVQEIYPEFYAECNETLLYVFFFSYMAIVITAIYVDFKRNPINVRDKPKSKLLKMLEKWTEEE